MATASNLESAERVYSCGIAMIQGQNNVINGDSLDLGRIFYFCQQHQSEQQRCRVSQAMILLRRRQRFASTFNFCSACLASTISSIIICSGDKRNEIKALGFCPAMDEPTTRCARSWLQADHDPQHQSSWLGRKAGLGAPPLVQVSQLTPSPSLLSVSFVVTSLLFLGRVS